jgi:UDP-N-acetylmuramoyl-tripeptide--D-alanyl-D-alanine ligase
VQNGLAGIAVGQLLDMEADEIRKGLMGFSGEHLRIDIKEKDGIKIIDDSYNAAPSSIKAALEVLCDIGTGMRKWAVLGDMLELGDWTQEAHKDIGRLAASYGIDYLIGIGEFAKWYKSGAEEVSNSKTVAALFGNIDEAKPYIQALMQKGDILLFKGSRRMNLDVLVKELLKEGLKGICKEY